MSRPRWFYALLLVGSVAAAVFLLWQPLGRLVADSGDLRQWLAAFGPWGPLVLVVVQVAQILVAPIPGYPVVVVGGLLFGGLWGGLASTVGMVLGAAVAAGLARRLGRPALHRFVSGSEMARWEHLILNESPWFWFLVVLLPTGEIPYFLAGLSGVSIPAFLLGVLAARGPAMFLIAGFAARATEVPPGALLTASALLLLVAGLLFWRRAAITAWTERLLYRAAPTPTPTRRS